MAREVDVLGRRCCELLGHGDVLRPWSWDAKGSHVQAEVGWTVLEETTLAVLDHGLVKRIVPWPTLGVELFNRGTRGRTTSRWRSRSPITSGSTTACCSRSGTSPSAGARVTPKGASSSRSRSATSASPTSSAPTGPRSRRRSGSSPEASRSPPRGRPLAAARRAAGAAAPPQARFSSLSDPPALLVWRPDTPPAPAGGRLRQTWAGRRWRASPRPRP